MELEHSFTVPVPKSRAWDVLLDVERVAPCMPGATLDSVDGDEIRGRIKVKVGPINMTYAGTARFIERDEDAGVVTLEASGKETRGAGTASASVRSVLEDGGDETYVKVHTKLNVTGKPAQFGRGVMNEVGGRLLNIFATNLAATLAEDGGSATQNASADSNSPGTTRSGSATAPAATNGAGPGSTTQAAGSAVPASAGTAEAGTSSASGPEASIDDLKLSGRVTNGLHKNGITTVGQLATKSQDELLAIDGIGRASVDDIKTKLGDLGLKLGEPKAPTPASSSAPAKTPAPATSAAPAHVPHAAAGRHAAQQLEDEALNLFKVAALPVLKRALPVLAAVAVALVIGLRAKARRRKR
jgi:carbon monoxide dehydrogenase subunit G/predicted flap endonuclease-1-like 5' DNA nuclease